MSGGPGRLPVLVVDDSAGTLTYLQRLLAPHVDVQLARTAPEALQVLSPGTALVVTDLHMPGPSGLELTAELRRRAPDVPVVMMTGVVDEFVQQEAAAAGARDVLRKPVTAAKLYPLLREYLGLTDLEVPPLEDDDPPPATTTHHPAMDLPGLLSGVRALGGVQAVTYYAADGARTVSSVGAPLPAELGGFVHAAGEAARGAAPFLGAAGGVRAVQVEYLDRVLLVVPVGDGLLAALTRDAASASTVKAWLRSAQFTLG